MWNMVFSCIDRITRDVSLHDLTRTLLFPTCSFYGKARFNDNSSGTQRWRCSKRIWIIDVGASLSN